MNDVFQIQGVLRLIGASQFNDELKKVESQTDSTSDRMMQSFQKLGRIITSALSVRAITGFAQTLVSAAAQVNASNAQFEATFKEVGEAAQTMFNRVSNATGVMTTRLRVAGTKAFSQFKGAGLDANDALSETERYLKLAADAAAYYDISLEDADTRLRSFIRGNVEAGDMIGLFTSETQRNSAALEEYGKKYIELTENQKQMIMLNIAENIYEQSGAIGQASRESGEFANQTGNLADAWLQLKAVLGEPILEAILPIMQELGLKMQDLVDWVNSNHEAVTALVNIFETAIKTFGTYITVAGGLKIIQTVTTWVKNLTTAQILLNTAMKANPVGLFVAALTGLIVVLNNANDSTTDLKDATSNLESISRKYQDAVNALSGNVGDLTEEEKKLYEQRIRLYKLQASEQVLALADSYDELSKSLNDATVKAEGAEGALDAMFFLDENVEGIDGVLREIEYARNQMARFDFGSAEYEYYRQYINAIESNFRKTEEELYPVIEGFYSNFVTAEKDVTTQMQEMESSILSIAEAVNDGLLNVDFLKLGNNELYSSIMDVVAKLKTDVKEEGADVGEEIVKSINTVVSSARIGIPSIEYGDSEKILQNMDKQIKAAEQMATVVGDSFDLSKEKANIYQNALQGLFEMGFTRGSAPVENIVRKLEQLNANVDDSNSLFGNLGDSVEEAFNKIYSYFSDVTSMTLDLVSSIQELQNQALEEEINTLEKQYEELQELNEQYLEDKENQFEEENDALKSQMQDGEISYRQYVDAIKANEKSLEDYKEQLDKEEAKSEEELQKKKDELGKKQFEAEKANKIAQVWLDAASASIRVFSENFWPVALGLEALILANAGVQTGVIAGQEYTPALAKGGIVDTPTQALIGEDGKEAVVPLERNTEWVGGLARALSPAITQGGSQQNFNGNPIRDEIVIFRQMVAEFFSYLRANNQQIVIDGQVVARIISPYVNTEMGNASRMRNRGI